MKVLNNEFKKCMEVATYVIEKLNQVGICDVDASIDVDLRGCFVWVTTNVEVDRKLEFTRDEIANVYGNSGKDYKKLKVEIDMGEDGKLFISMFEDEPYGTTVLDPDNFTETVDKFIDEQVKNFKARYKIR